MPTENLGRKGKLMRGALVFSALINGGLYVNNDMLVAGQNAPEILLRNFKRNSELFQTNFSLEEGTDIIYRTNKNASPSMKTVIAVKSISGIDEEMLSIESRVPHSILEMIGRRFAGLISGNFEGERDINFEESMVKNQDFIGGVWAAMMLKRENKHTRSMYDLEKICSGLYYSEMYERIITDLGHGIVHEKECHGILSHVPQIFGVKMSIIADETIIGVKRENPTCKIPKSAINIIRKYVKKEDWCDINVSDNRILYRGETKNREAFVKEMANAL
jgi:hypothetical protein